MEGLLLFYKPKNWRNKDILKFFQGVFPGVKIGHAGTLDPFAEGLMVMGLGRKFTKKLHDLLLHSRKEYAAKMELGKISDTYDIEGKISESGLQKPNLKEIKIAIEENFLGERLQVPPIFSAKKYMGKRLRDIVNSNILKNIGINKDIGEIAKSKSKMVLLYDFEIISYKYPFLEIKLSVSSGFYIRSFTDDLGKKLKTGAYLTELKRTKLGDFSVEQALKPEDFNTVGHSEHVRFTQCKLREESQSMELWGKISGKVQGVGFRYFINNAMKKLNLSGWVENNADGSVEFSVQGELKLIVEFQKSIKRSPDSAIVSDYYFIVQKP